MTLTMYDTVTVDTVPANPPAVAGYTSGNWPTFLPLVKRFPHAQHLSIAVQATEDAEALDCEAGDASPDQAPGWVRRQMGRGIYRPVVYASVSSMPQVLAMLSQAGITRKEVRLWTAHYTDTPHICSPGCGFGFDTTADATQWTMTALGRNLDESLCSDSFFGPPAPPLDSHRYDRYPTGPFEWDRGGGKVERVSERALVRECDHLQVHPRLHSRRLDELRRNELTFLRKRVWYVGHFDPRTGERRKDPLWGGAEDKDWHLWRWERLLARTLGETA